MKIDAPKLIEQIQLARATGGLTIRDCVAKLNELDPLNSIIVDEWIEVEAGRLKPRAEFAYKVAALLGFETPIELDQGEPAPAGPKSYRAGVLTDDESDQLLRLLRDLTDFCSAKGVGLCLVASSNLQRTTVPSGFKEESSTIYRRTNLHALASTVAPLAQMLMSTKGESQAMSKDEAMTRFDGYTMAIHELVQDSLNLSPGPDAVLAGFYREGPRFK